MGQLDGLRGVVTGGAAGIGLAIALAFREAGATVAVLDRSPQPPAELAGADGITYLAADVTDDPVVRQAVERAAALLGGIDLLVNNAGIGAQGSVVDSDDDEWHRVLDVNVVGTARVSRAAWPHLVA